MLTSRITLHTGVFYSFGKLLEDGFHGIGNGTIIAEHIFRGVQQAFLIFFTIFMVFRHRLSYCLDLLQDNTLSQQFAGWGILITWPRGNDFNLFQFLDRSYEMDLLMVSMFDDLCQWTIEQCAVRPSSTLFRCYSLISCVRLGVYAFIAIQRKQWFCVSHFT